MTGDRGERRRRHAGGIGDLIVHCVRQATSAAPSTAVTDAVARVGDVRHLVDAAQHHGVAPAVYRVLGRSPALPDDVAADLEAAYQRQWQVHLRALADLAEVVELLDGMGVGWLVVKGPVLAETVYQRLDIRSYVDLDVVVHRSSLPAVLKELEASGALVLDRNWTLIRHDVRGELTLTLRHGSALDLHWHLFNEHRVRRAFSLSMEDVLARARRVNVNGLATWTLDAADTLVYLAAHAGLAGGHRLVWFKDIEQVVAREAPDWDEVVRRSRASGLALVVATMMARACRVFDADVPVAVLDALAPRVGWRAVIAATDRLSPPQRSFGHQLTARTVVAATRRTGLASVVELGRASWSDVARPFFTDAGHPWRRRISRGAAPEPAANPLWQPSGEDVDRQAFLWLVSQAPVEP